MKGLTFCFIMLLAVYSMQFCNDFTRLTDIKPVGKVSTAIDKLTQLAVMKKIRCSENTRQMLERARQMDLKRMRTRREFMRILFQLGLYSILEI
uniref:Putative secreted protein n=1 Tax=Rhipicephalus microplus TaxID=6941 RepID=A0A6G5A0G8_RHIMP